MQIKQLINRYSINDQYIFQYFSLQAKCLSNVVDRQMKENEQAFLKKRLKVYFYSETEIKEEQMESKCSET